MGPVAVSSSLSAQEATVVTGPASDLSKLTRETIKLVAPPSVHAHEQATKAPPNVVEFRMVIEEKQRVIDEIGTKVWTIAFNGSVPGPLLVIHQDDYVELTLVNPETNTLSHNIDVHAATGGLGGAALTLIGPGEQRKLRFKATLIDRHARPRS